MITTLANLQMTKVMKEIKSPKRVGNDAGDENLTTWDSRFENNEDGQSPERNPVNLVKIRTNAQS
jgi:hypothetical protein